MFDIKIAEKHQGRYFSFSIDRVGGRQTIKVDNKPIHVCRFLPKAIELTEQGNWEIIEPEYYDPLSFNLDSLGPSFFDVEILECNYNDGGIVDYD